MAFKIKTPRDLSTAFRHGKYSSVGGYPLFFVTHDGEALSWDAVRANYMQVARAVRDKGMGRDAWLVVASDVNWEDPGLFCADSGERIESAYAEPEDD